MARADIKSSMPPDDPDGHADGQPPADRGGPLTRQEFAALYRQSSRALWCIAAGEVGDRTLAEDIVQQAAIVAFERLAEFNRGSSFLAWMAKITRFIAMNEVHKTIRRKTTPVDPATIDTARQSADLPHRNADAVSRTGQLHHEQGIFDDRVLAALKTLDTVPRCCLLLRVVLDTPYKEIAQILEIPQGTAMSHVDRARKALRERLSAMAPASAAAAPRTGSPA